VRPPRFERRWRYEAIFEGKAICRRFSR